MGEVSTIGLDLAKEVFQVHGADAAGAVVFRKRLRRTAVLQFFAAQAPCRVAMEACASSHYWGRELSRLGHEVLLIPPSYVKPFVKRQKNDAADAEAICEASQRPTMRFVQIRSEAAGPRSSGPAAHTNYQRAARSSGGIRTGRRKGTGSCRAADCASRRLYAFAAAFCASDVRCLDRSPAFVG